MTVSSHALGGCGGGNGGGCGGDGSGGGGRDGGGGVTMIHPVEAYSVVA